MRRVIVPIAASVVLFAAAALQEPRLSRFFTHTPKKSAAARSGSPWLTNEVEAKRIAEEKKLPMLIDFYAEWCGPCHDLEETVFSHPEFLKRRDKIVALRFDVTDDSQENSAILARYNVSGLPTVVFIDRNGQPRLDARIEGAAPLGEFLRTLDSL